MNENNLDKVLTYIGTAYGNGMTDESRYYREVDIGETARRLGLSDMGDRYRHAKAIVLLKEPESGMKVRIDGRTFVNYAQFDSGVVVPGYVAEDTAQPRRAYHALDSMVLVF